MFFDNYHPYNLSITLKALAALEYFELTLLRLLIKNWYLGSYESLAYNYTLPLSSWWFIRVSNAFAFPYPEFPIINILYWLSGTWGQSGLCFFMFSPILSSIFFVFKLFFFILLHLISSFPWYYVFAFCINKLFKKNLNILSKNESTQ